VIRHVPAVLGLLVSLSASSVAQVSSELSREEWEILRGQVTELALYEEGRRKAEDMARRLANGVDPAIAALRSCDHAVRNASGAPWLAADATRRCASHRAEAGAGTPQLKGSVETCFARYEKALAALEASNGLYEQARRTAAPRQGQLVKQAQALQREGKAAIGEGEQCLGGVVQLAVKIGELVAEIVQQALSSGRRPPTGSSGGMPGPSRPTPGQGSPQEGTASRPPAQGSPPSSAAPDTSPCVPISDDTRRRLLELASQVEPWWQSNFAATGEFFGGLVQMAWDDLVSIAKFGYGAFDRYARAADPGQTVARDIESGILGARSAAGQYLSSPQKLDQFDPVRLVRIEVERYQKLWNESHARGAARGAYNLLNLAPLPGCGGVRAAINPVREARAVTRAEHVTTSLSGAGRRAAAFADGWGNQPQTGARGTRPASVGGNPHNPECGEYNCFAVSVAKARSFATGRRYSARAVRPGEAADVPIRSAEMHNILASTYGLRGVRQAGLYTSQELVEHALGMPSRMNMDRIATILTRSGPGAQGLVFVRVPAHQPTFPGETVGHVFNAVNENGAVRFIDAQPAGGEMDARMWFLPASETWFYEVR
jgi:hypothetical protein